MLVQCAVVYENIFGGDSNVLRELVVGADFIHGLRLVPFTVAAIHVVASLNVGFLLLDRSDGEGIQTVGFAAIAVERKVCVLLVVGSLETFTRAVDIFRTESPVALRHVFRTHGISVLRQAFCHAVFLSRLIGIAPFAGIRTLQAEHSDAHSLYRHHPHAASHCFLLVNVLAVYSLTVEHSCLIVEQRSAFADIQEITLQLYTDVAAVARLLS